MVGRSASGDRFVTAAIPVEWSPVGVMSGRVMRELVQAQFRKMALGMVCDEGAFKCEERVKLSDEIPSRRRRGLEWVPFEQTGPPILKMQLFQFTENEMVQERRTRSAVQ